MAFIVVDIVPVLVMNQAPEGMILVVARPAKAALLLPAAQQRNKMRMAGVIGATATITQVENVSGAMRLQSATEVVATVTTLSADLTGTTTEAGVKHHAKVPKGAAETARKIPSIFTTKQTPRFCELYPGKWMKKENPL